MAIHGIIQENDADGSPGIEASVENPNIRQLSRSPHPYHRRQSTLPATLSDSGETNHNWRGKIKTSSDSGTEADDEGSGILRGLPAPLNDRGGITDAKRSWKAAKAKSYSKRDSSEATEASGVDIRVLPTSKRLRIEVLQRICETGSILVVALTVLLRDDVRSGIGPWARELFIFSLLVPGLYALFPLRMCSDGSYRSKWKRIVSFPFSRSIDPAPLIYPILLPVLVALSLGPTCNGLILPNIILSLSSLPASAIPLHGFIHGYSTTHWMVTFIPFMVSETSLFGYNSPKSLSLFGLDPELLIILFPLQQTTISILNFLLTTSLLPSEVQLLATVLINVLLFSHSPQAQIIKGLLWIGSLCLLITCRQILRWEVILARIPTWKFRRSSGALIGGRARGGEGNVSKWLNWLLGHRISRRFSEEQSSDSDSLDEASSIRKIRGSGTFTTSSDRFKRSETFPPQHQSSVRTRDVDDEGNHDGVTKTTMAFSDALDRRHTFSTKTTSKTTIKTTAGGRRKRLMAPGIQPFLSLTVPQARFRKCVYASYVYLVVILIIIFPVRWYISENALSEHDPFGWALGYLFGNIPSVRFWLLLCNLEVWACTPPLLYTTGISSCHLGWIEHLRHDTFGEANTRLVICAYCLLILCFGMALVLQLSNVVEVDTRRKVFHGMMVAMFVPTIFIDPAFISLALTLVLAVFLLLELFRASQLPPISRPITHFLAPYVDGRDHRGPVVISHIFLLTGCALPLWLSLAGATHGGAPPWEGWEIGERDISMLSGVICVGMGDAAASLVGRRYGKRKWFWGGDKSIEGSVAFAVAVFVGLISGRIWLVVGGWESQIEWVLTISKSLFAAVASSFTEAVLTGGNDNVVVPLVLWLLVRGLCI